MKRASFLAVCAYFATACATVLAAADSAGLSSEPSDIYPVTFARTEARAPCAHHTPFKRPFFGDTHIHTGLSLDAYMQGARMTPEDAYRFARGEVLSLPTGADADSGLTPSPLAEARLSAPLDFAVVADHAEMLGEGAICNNPSHPQYGNWACWIFRNVPFAARLLFTRRLSFTPDTPGGEIGHLAMCGEGDQVCHDASAGVWQQIQAAADNAYDVTDDCSFTSFIGYEWTSTPNANNLHRVVIYRNDKVPALPVEALTATSPQALWQGLQDTCVDGIEGCEVIAIPHNSNLSGGAMFELDETSDGAIDLSAVRQRRVMEPLVEIFQRKGGSECAAMSNDELCGFEKFHWDDMSQTTVPKFLREEPVEQAYVRYALKKGLAVEAAHGQNPFQLGFIGSTDTHMGISGQVEEDRYSGHGGAMVAGVGRADPDNGLTDKAYYNPGGLAVIWAEENSRDALFNGMQRRETYGTSGPRIVLRTFGGWALKDDMCDSPNFAEQGYQNGVAMGSMLPAKPAGIDAPVFAVSAMASSNDLQRLQIIKGWSEQGESFEKVFDIAGDSGSHASVNLDTCEPRGRGYRSLCKVWSDPDFKEDQNAFYYARVVENPSCRWHVYQCLAAQISCDGTGNKKVPEGLESCCSDEFPKTIQERAWSSPIWYKPITPLAARRSN